LQRYVNRLLGPVFILVGMVLLNMLALPGGRGQWAQRIGQRVEGWGIGAGFVLGIAFALSFCPASAALFFATLIPLSVKTQSPIVLPLVFGIGTALPVVLFALLLVTSVNAIGRAYRCIAVIDRWGRRVTGVVFVVLGIHLCLVYIYGAF
jgi:cytochrome c biogenesis protein CcdA